MTIENCKITRTRFLNSILKPSLWLLFIIALGICSYTSSSFDDRLMLFITIFIFFALLVGIYPLYTLYTYYRRDKNAVLILNNGKKELVYENEKIRLDYKYDDISSFRKVKWHMKYQSGIYYYEVSFNDGNVLYITSLLRKGLEKSLSAIPMVTEERWTALIR